MRGRIFTLTALILPILVTGCGSPYKDDSATIADESAYEGKVRVEAYLFDAKLKRDGKPTTVRLDFYQTDTVIAVAGRGYLGKGALKGKLTADSMEVYFPTTDEYLLEPVAEVLGSANCSGDLPEISLLALFSDLPDSVLAGSGLIVESDYSDHRHPEFRIHSNDCLWTIEATYAYQREGWRLKEFAFDDGKGIELKGSRRKYKRDAEVKATKFLVPVKIGSARIIP